MVSTMRHRKASKKLGRTSAHRKAMLRSLATSLFLHERVKTTLAKAKELRRVADRLITLAKRGDLLARRLAAPMLHDPQALKRLFATIGPRFRDRSGGYTRIYRLESRKGDNASMAFLELVVQEGDRTSSGEEKKGEMGEEAARRKPWKRRKRGK